MKKKILALGLLYAALCLFSLAVNIKIAISLLLVGILVLFAFAALLYINKSVKKTQWYKSVIPNMSLYPTNEWYREHLERNFDVVNIGSSSARYAFDYSGLPVKAFNWGEQPQSLNNGFKILKTYFSILKKGGTVIISLGPLSGLDVEGKWQKDANDKYYYILPSELINDYSSVVKRRNYPLVYYPITSIKNLLRKTFGKENGQNTELIKTFVDDSETARGCQALLSGRAWGGRNRFAVWHFSSSSFGNIICRKKENSEKSKKFLVTTLQKCL